MIEGQEIMDVVLTIRTALFDGVILLDNRS